MININKSNMLLDTTDLTYDKDSKESHFEQLYRSM